MSRFFTAEHSLVPSNFVLVMSCGNGLVFLAELARFDNSQNVKMRVIQAFAEVFTTLQNATSTFPEFQKHGSDGLTLFRTELLAPSRETRSFVFWAPVAP
jgi:hypothetical protein